MAGGGSLEVLREYGWESSGFLGGSSRPGSTAYGLVCGQERDGDRLGPTLQREQMKVRDLQSELDSARRELMAKDGELQRLRSAITMEREGAHDQIQGLQQRLQTARERHQVDEEARNVFLERLGNLQRQVLSQEEAIHEATFECAGAKRKAHKEKVKYQEATMAAYVEGFKQGQICRMRIYNNNTNETQEELQSQVAKSALTSMRATLHTLHEQVESGGTMLTQTMDLQNFFSLLTLHEGEGGNQNGHVLSTILDPPNQVRQVQGVTGSVPVASLGSQFHFEVPSFNGFPPLVDSLAASRLSPARPTPEIQEDTSLNGDGGWTYSGRVEQHPEVVSGGGDIDVECYLSDPDLEDGAGYEGAGASISGESSVAPADLSLGGNSREALPPPEVTLVPRWHPNHTKKNDRQSILQVLLACQQGSLPAQVYANLVATENVSGSLPPAFFADIDIKSQDPAVLRDWEQFDPVWDGGTTELRCFWALSRVSIFRKVDPDGEIKFTAPRQMEFFNMKSSEVLCVEGGNLVKVYLEERKTTSNQVFKLNLFAVHEPLKNAQLGVAQLVRVLAKVYVCNPGEGTGRKRTRKEGESEYLSIPDQSLRALPGAPGSHEPRNTLSGSSKPATSGWGLGQPSWTVQEAPSWADRGGVEEGERAESAMNGSSECGSRSDSGSEAGRGSGQSGASATNSEERDFVEKQCLAWDVQAAQGGREGRGAAVAGSPTVKGSTAQDEVGDGEVSSAQGVAAHAGQQLMLGGDERRREAGKQAEVGEWEGLVEGALPIHQRDLLDVQHSASSGEQTGGGGSQSHSEQHGERALELEGNESDGIPEDTKLVRKDSSLDEGSLWSVSDKHDGSSESSFRESSKHSLSSPVKAALEAAIQGMEGLTLPAPEEDIIFPASEAVWVVEMRADSLEATNMCALAFAEVRKRGPAAARLAVCFVSIMTEVPACGPTKKARAVSQVEEQRREGHKRVVESELLEPAVRTWMRWVQQAAQAASARPGTVPLPQVRAFSHVEMNDKREVGLMAVVARLNAERLYISVKRRRMLVPGWGDAAAYCAQHLPATCSFTVHKDGKAVQHLQAQAVIQPKALVSPQHESEKLVKGAFQETDQAAGAQAFL